VHRIIDYAMDNDEHLQKARTTSYMVIAIVSALALFGVVAVTIVTIPQQEAEARGCNNGVAVNASKGRCFGH
jgi:hypothetical protein